MTQLIHPKNQPGSNQPNQQHSQEQQKNLPKKHYNSFNWKTLVIIFVIILIIVLIILYILLVEKRISNISVETPETPNDSPLAQSHNVKAKADIVNINSSLQAYQSINYTYPIGSSFESMAEELLELRLIQSIPAPPSDKFTYKYCSSNGTEFYLESEKIDDDTQIIVEGTDTCIPHE